MSALGLLCAIAACPGSETREDKGHPAPVDAGASDHAVADQGSHPDQVAPDASGVDAALPVDGSAASDTAVLDRATQDRAGTDLATDLDASTAADTAAGVDASTATDAATDAATGVDASTAADAATGVDTQDAGPECSDEDGGPSCAPPLACCSNLCVNLAQDPAHCGSCGLRCDPAGYCAGSPGCTALDFGTLCENDTRYDLRTAATDDNLVLTATADAIAALCSGTVTHSTLSDAALVDQATFAPLVGVGHLLILHGGPYFQHMTRYFEQQGIAPLRYSYDAVNDRDRFVRTDGTGVALDVEAALNTDSHDYFLVELFADPARGALILASYGFDLPGSRAAGWYIVHHLLAAPAPLASWYIVEWTDLDTDQAPSSLDEFTLRVSAAD